MNSAVFWTLENANTHAEFEEGFDLFPAHFPADRHAAVVVVGRIQVGVARQLEAVGVRRRQLGGRRERVDTVDGARRRKTRDLGGLVPGEVRIAAEWRNGNPVGRTGSPHGDGA